MDSGAKQRRTPRTIKVPCYTDEERRAGIVRLLAEATVSLFRKRGLLKKLQGMEKPSFPRQTRYAFLRGPEAQA